MVDGNFLNVVAISEKYKSYHITTSHLGMVSAGAGAKRHSEDEALVQESDMKKPRVQQGDSQGGEGQGAGKLTANEELKVRIKKYLEENRPTRGGTITGGICSDFCVFVLFRFASELDFRAMLL